MDLLHYWLPDLWPIRCVVHLRHFQLCLCSASQFTGISFVLRSMGILLSGPDWVIGCRTSSGHWGVVAALPYCSLVSSSYYRTFMIETD